MWGWGKWLDQKNEKNVGVGGSEKNPFPPPYTIKNGTALTATITNCRDLKNQTPFKTLYDKNTNTMKKW